MGEVPVEIIKLEILPRVIEANSLVRFKCVCKDWLSTLEFAKRHLLESRKHPQQPKLILLDPPSQSETFRTIDCETPHTTTIGRCNPFKAHGYKVLYLASLDGLICVALMNHKFELKLMLWNPLTGACKKLSSKYIDHDQCSSSNKHRVRNIDAIGLYVDDDDDDDYKLLHVTCNRNNASAFMGAYIYSLRLDRWRRVESFLENNASRQRIFNHWWRTPVVFCNKSLYFTAGNGELGERLVISFDVNTETFTEIPFPRNDVPSEASDRRWHLVDVNGCIHLYYHYEFNYRYRRGFVNSEIGLWRMEAGEQWKKVAGFVDMRMNAPRLWFYWELIYISENSYQNWLVTGYHDTCIYTLDFKTKDRVRLYGDRYHNIPKALYIESFLSPNPNHS